MAGEQTPSTPNFFVLLGLHPDDPWDDKHFEQVLEAKRSEWARKSNSIGSMAMEAKRNLARYAEIRRVMTDPTARMLQVAEAKKVLAADNKTKIELFERQLDIAARKGFLEQAEFDKFLADFKNVLSENEIKKRIKVPTRTANAQGAKEQQQLDPTTIKAINEKLRLLQKNDLYELLGMPDTTSSSVLCKAAQELYEEMQRRQPKTADVTMQSELAGHAKIIFKTEDMRQKYNESRRLSNINALLDEFEKTVNIASSNKQKGLYSGQVALFLERATRDGWSQEEARTRLGEHARKRNWFLEVPTLDISTENQRCGYCKALNAKGREVCSECGKELRITCPNCNQPARSDEVGCGKCGFPIGNRYLVDELLADYRSLLTQQELHKADAQLKQAEEAWAPQKPDARLRQIQGCRAELQRLLQARQQTVEQLRTYINAHQFFTARDYLRLQAASVPDRETYLQTMNNEISQAQALLKQAKTTLNVDQKIDLCIQALRICADYKEAHDVLSTVPPSPPSNLQAKVSEATISLQWTPSPTRNVYYKIVRKTRSQPISIKDGNLLATVAGRIFDDTQPEVGIPTFYAVFASVEDITSTDAATLQQPVMLTKDVGAVKPRIDNQLIELTWHAPPHVHTITIVRKEKAPSSSLHDGVQLTPLDLSHLVDRSVQNGHLYFYTIYCQFKDYNGRIITSPGVTQSATPEAPPEIIYSLEIASTRVAQGYEVQLRWSSPTKGDVVILKSSGPPNLKQGDSFLQSELAHHGTLLQQQANSCIDSWKQPGVAYYTPIVIFQGMAYIGRPQRFAVVDDVSNLKYQNLGTAIRLNWTWPANCTEVLVAYDYQNWPQIENATPNTSKITRAEYEHRGYYDIRGTQNRDHYIVVAAIVKQGADQIVGTGTRIQARLASKIVISYEIRALRSLFGPKKRMLRISSRTVGMLPTLVIVSKQGRLPIRKEEGEPMFRLEGPRHIENDLEIELPDTSFSPRTFGKLYLEDDGMYELVTIHHPSEEKLRLA